MKGIYIHFGVLVTVAALLGSNEVRSSNKKENPFHPALIILKDIKISSKLDLEGPVLNSDAYRKLQENAQTFWDQKDYEKLDALLDQALEQQGYNVHGKPVYSSLIYRLEEPQETRSLSNSWTQSTESTHAYLVNGIIEKNLAWDARGSGWANTVTDEGWRLFRKGLERSEDSLEKAIKLSPRNMAAYGSLITVGMGRGEDPSVVFELFSKAKALEGPKSEILKRTGYYLLPRWHGDAQTYAGFVIKYSSEFADTYYKFRTLFDVIGYTSRWIEQDKKVIYAHRDIVKQIDTLVDGFSRLWPESDIYHYTAANELIANRNLKDGLRLANDGLSRHPNSARLLVARGRAHTETRKYIEAIADLTRAVELEPVYGLAHYRLACAYHWNESYLEARKAFLDAIKTLPKGEEWKIANSHRRLCFGGSATDDHEFAVKHGNEAIKAAPDNGYGYYYRGYAFAEMGELKKAKQDFIKAIQCKESLRSDIILDFEAWETW
ncbi:MAG: DUF4034 domain-containing protein [Verrucomicrobiota bacterium]